MAMALLGGGGERGGAVALSITHQWKKSCWWVTGLLTERERGAAAALLITHQSKNNLANIGNRLLYGRMGDGGGAITHQWKNSLAKDSICHELKGRDIQFSTSDWQTWWFQYTPPPPLYLRWHKKLKYKSLSLGIIWNILITLYVIHSKKCSGETAICWLQALTMTMTTANGSFHMTVQLIMVHHHTKFGYTCSRRLVHIQTKPRAPSKTINWQGKAIHLPTRCHNIEGGEANATEDNFRPRPSCFPSTQAALFLAGCPVHTYRAVHLKGINPTDLCSSTNGRVASLGLVSWFFLLLLPPPPTPGFCRRAHVMGLSGLWRNKKQ